MRRLSGAALAAIFFVAHGQLASAADLPEKPKAAPIVAAPTANWSGWYVGLNAGGAWENTIDNSASVTRCTAIVPVFCPASAAAVPGKFDTNPSGFIGGGQIGFNWETNSLVWGIEADFQGSAIKGSQSVSNTRVLTGFPANPLTVSGTGSQKIDWFGTLRGRVGWLPVSSLLVYATGGLAYGHVKTGVSFTEQIVNPTPLNGSTSSSQSSTRTGWTVGVGLEWMFAPNWSVKGEYLYYDLGTVTLNQTLTVFTPIPTAHVGVAIQSDAHYHGNIARLGVNYKF